MCSEIIPTPKENKRERTPGNKLFALQPKTNWEKPQFIELFLQDLKNSKRKKNKTTICTNWTLFCLAMAPSVWVHIFAGYFQTDKSPKNIFNLQSSSFFYGTFLKQTKPLSIIFKLFFLAAILMMETLLSSPRKISLKKPFQRKIRPFLYEMLIVLYPYQVKFYENYKSGGQPSWYMFFFFLS